MDRIGLQLISASKSLKFDKYANADDLAAESLDQIAARDKCSASGDEIIYDQDAMPRLDRICMDLQRVGAVFKFVILGDGVEGQFAGLAYRDKANVHGSGDCGSKDEAA